MTTAVVHDQTPDALLRTLPDPETIRDHMRRRMAELTALRDLLRLTERLESDRKRAEELSRTG
jgi:hypothetical protein